MIHQYLLLFMPLFVGMVLLEHRIGKLWGLKLYTKDQTIASVVIGIGQQILRRLPMGIAPIAIMGAFLASPIRLDATAWWYIPALFVAVEFFYYWHHRASHEIRWFWATHAVHHSTEEMNVLAANRLGWTQVISSSAIIYAPLAMMGFHPLHVMIMLAVNLMYQSWLHTTLIGKLGPLEGIFNTPSAHRVHHARNADYLDRNHGGVLMIFDRMFGTYVEEKDNVPVEFGLVSPPPSANPFRIAFHEWINIVDDLRTYPIRHWPMLMFGPPGWKPNGEGKTSKEIREEYRASHDVGVFQPAE